MKKLFLILSLIAAISVNAATSSTSLSGAATNSVLTTGARISSLTIANAGTNTLTLKIFDAPSTSLTYTIAAWAYLSNYTGNATSTVVTSTGTTNSYIYTNVLLWTSVTNAATTNSYATAGTFTVPAGETLVVPYTQGLNLYQGLLMTNNAPGDTATVTISYSSRY